MVGAVALGTAAICDWVRPPQEQLSVVVYEKVVVGSYRHFLQPMTGRFIHCRFQPSCSRYSEEAMHAHGFPKGLQLTASRLLRCMPWVPVGTLDPVPPEHAKLASTPLSKL